MMVRKIRLLTVKFKGNPIGSIVTVGKDIKKPEADALVKWENAEEIIESKLPKEEGGK